MTTHNNFAVRRVALAAMVAAVCPASGLAAVTASGSFGTGPAPVAIGPGDTVHPTSALYIGSPGVGSLLVDNGSFLQLARLSFGLNGTGNGSGIVSGTNSRVELVGDGQSNQQVQRLGVGDWGQGSLTVNQGGRVDTSGNQTPCLLAFHFCDSFVGGAAGDTAVLNIDGAGSVVRTGQNLFVAAPGLAVLALDGYTYGVPGGTTRGTVNVTNGASLQTDRAQVAPRHWSTAATGRERNIGEVNISGAGSRWTVVGGNVVDNVSGAISMGDAVIVTANDRNSVAAFNVTNGGVVEIQGSAGTFNGILLTNGGGRTDALVSGANSKIVTTGPNGYLQVGRRLGSARLDVLDGGAVEGLYYFVVGRDGSFGEAVVNGTGSRISVTQFAEEALQGTNRAPAVNVGRDGGTGVLTVSGGALFEVSGSGQAAANSPHITVGSGAASTGTFNIQGSGTRVEVRSASVLPGGGAGEALGAYVGVGQQGGGAMNITGGAKLVLSSTVVSTDADRRSTVLNIGGANDTTAGARGTAVVRGAGSEISINGAERFVAVGRGPSSFGQLTLADGGKLSATTMNVGRSGAVGVLQMDAGVIELTGQFAAPVAALTSTGFGIGISSGTGIVRMDNGSTISMTNLGTGGMGVTLGGSTNFAEGDGSLTMAGASSITVTAATGLGTFTVGRQGSGLLRMSGASTIHIGDGRFYVARDTGSDGTVIATSGSVINAGWLGVGRNRLSDGSTVDGGTATMVLNGATVNVAGDVFIGTNGFLGGTAGSIVASGTITNYGIFSPGSSPGTFTIDGDYVAGAGSRLILEVQRSANGSFETDLVYFKQGNTLDLAALNIEFRFLGGTSPDEFKQSGGFDIDTFLAVQTAGGQEVEVDHALLANTSYSARADAYTFTSFDFSADGGATFVAVPVPEPGSWALLLAGIGGLAALARRRANSSAG